MGAIKHIQTAPLGTVLWYFDEVAMVIAHFYPTTRLDGGHESNQNVVVIGDFDDLAKKETCFFECIMSTV